MANETSVYVQPSSQTPIAIARLIGMPGMMSSHRIRDGVDVALESGCLAMRYASTSPTTTHTGIDTARKRSTPALSGAGVSVITRQE